MRLKETSGAVTYLKCTADGSTTAYKLYTSSLHLDSGTSAYFGGQLNSENIFIYRTGAEIGDESCMFQNSVLYNSTFYKHTSYDLKTENYTMEYISDVSKLPLV